MIAQAASPSLTEVTLSYLSHAPVKEENHKLDRIMSSWKVSRYGDSLWLDKMVCHLSITDIFTTTETNRSLRCQVCLEGVGRSSDRAANER